MRTRLVGPLNTEVRRRRRAAPHSPAGRRVAARHPA
jgi:hypothetical protein